MNDRIGTEPLKTFAYNRSGINAFFTSVEDQATFNRHVQREICLMLLARIRNRHLENKTQIDPDTEDLMNAVAMLAGLEFRS